MKATHNLKPIYDNSSKVLILGSFPSVKSREVCSYYAHPKNRFWKILSILYEEEIDDKEKFLLKHHIALWDVIASCEIVGSSDASIKNVKVNDIKKIIKASKIEKVFTTGKKAYDLYNKYLRKELGMEAIYLPSPSPANAAMSLDKLVLEYKKIKY